MLSLNLKDFTSAFSIEDVKAKLAKFKNTDEYQVELDKNLKNLREDLSKKYSELESDNDILCSVYRQVKESQTEGLGVATELKSTIEEIRELKDQMETALMDYALCGWGSGRSFEEMFSELFDPLIEALDPLLDPISMLGIPEIPIISTIPELIKKFANLGRIISKLPPEIRRQAIAEAEEAKKQNKKTYEEKREAAGANTTWKRMAYDYENSDSIIWKLIREIVEIFKAVIEMLETICSCLEVFAILIVIDKFKPILDQFKIMVGDAVTIFEGVKDLLKCIITGKYSLLKLLQKVLMSKVESIVDILTYVCSGTNLPSNALISACYADIISCQCDISAFQLSIDYLEGESKILYESKMIEKCEEDIKNSEKTISKLESKTPPSVKKIQLQKDIQDHLKELSENLTSTQHEDLIMSLDNYIKASSFDANKQELYKALLIEKTSQDEYLKYLNTPVASGNKDAATGKFVWEHKTGR